MAGLSSDGQIICRAEDLPEGGRGVRFGIRRAGEVVPAFAIRFRGEVHAYLNRCAHRQIELDWIEGDFFDADGRFLVCATHGARYEPASGVCVDGPCRGGALIKLPVRERDATICLDTRMEYT